MVSGGGRWELGEGAYLNDLPYLKAAYGHRMLYGRGLLPRYWHNCLSKYESQINQSTAHPTTTVLIVIYTLAFPLIP